MIPANIIFIKGHDKSTQLADQCKASCEKYAIKHTMVPGVTPETLSAYEMHYPLKPLMNSRAWDYEKQNQPMLANKKSCFLNHVLFWKRVIADDIPMIFLEHDALALRPMDKIDFDELLVLNMDSAFRHNKNLWKKHKGSYIYKNKKPVLRPLESSLKYWKANLFNGSVCVPGTASYAVTPKGAKRLWDSVWKNGWDQSDFFINSKNVNIEYVDPDVFGFNGVNLQTSKGFGNV
jgi:GR25 family glycosyltransferase involved in LPS biosynthesis